MAKEPGSVLLAVDADDAYQFQVDGLPWSDLRQAPSGVLRVKHPLLGLPGEHRIRLRGQRGDDYRTLGPRGELVVTTPSL